MDIEAIINSCGYESERSKKNLELWLKSISPLLDKKDIKESLSNEQVLREIFQKQKNGGMSAQNYTRVKQHLNTLQTFYGIPRTAPSREVVLKANKQTCLYKNLDALLDFVDKVGKSSIHSFNRNEDLLNVKSIAILGWHGFSLAEISAFKKDQLRSDGESCMAGDTLIEPRFFAILKRFAAIDEYRGFPGGKLQKYKSDNKYLFRSTLSKQLIVSARLADILKRFNKIAGSFSNAIVFGKLKENALFVEVAKEMPLQNIAHKIEEIFKYDIKTAYRKQMGFLHWYNETFLS